MSNWQAIPLLVGTGSEAVHRFAASIGLSQSDLRQSDWEAIPYFAPTDTMEEGFAWEQHTYAVYRVLTKTKDLWLFWLAIQAWRKGELLPFEPQAVTHWQRPDPKRITRCAHSLCLNPSFMWPDPAISFEVQMQGHQYPVNFYGCSEEHRADLQRATGITLALKTLEEVPVATQTIHFLPSE